MLQEVESDLFLHQIQIIVALLAWVRWVWPNPSILREGFSDRSIFKTEYFDNLDSFGLLIFGNKLT